MKLNLRKVRLGGTLALVPADEHAQQYCEKLSLTDILVGYFSRPRNIKFHRKYFAMLNTAYEMWDAPLTAEYKGKTYEVEKSIEVFRDWLTVMAGHYDVVVLPTGGVKFVAKSIAFHKMDEDEFSKLYSDTINAIIKHVLPDGGDEDEYMAIFQRILEFD